MYNNKSICNTVDDIEHYNGTFNISASLVCGQIRI